MIADKLKKSVLQTAIQGKLTEQLPTDGDAKDLLNQIRAEKSKLIADGKIKTEKPLPPISDSEKPFDIPDSWQWVRLGEIINLISGQDLSLDCHNTDGNGVPYITGASNIVDEKIIINRWTTSPTTTAEYGDLLLSCKGTVGKIAFLKESSAHIARQIMAIKISKFVDKFYIKFFIEKNVQNLKSQAKSMIPGISRNNLLILPLPLPPLAEQKRIVARLEKILPEIELLAESERELDDLQKNFPRRMKNSILQAAIQGKLTEQLPTDGDARGLLQKIRAEKSKLIADGKIKPDKPLSPIQPDEIPFDIPQNWQWVRLGDICEIYTGNSISEAEKKSKYLGLSEGFNYIGTKDVSFDNKIDYENGVKIPFKNNFRRALKNSVLLCIEGGSAGRKIALTNREVCFGNKLCNFYSESVSNSYIYFYLQSPAFRKNFYDNLSGMIGGVSIKKLNLIPICLPPLAEQKRIVARLEELLPLCEI